VAQPVLGEAHVRISPDVSRFAADLQRSLAPQLAQVERSIQRTFGTAGFAQAGQQAAGGFTSSFGKGLQQQTSGLFVPVTAGLEKAGDEGAKKAVSRIARNRNAFAQEGQKSGRTFGGGFGEGFAALAAFAIASRVRRFFTDTIQVSLDFEQAFAGVRKTVEGSPAEFIALEESIRNLGTRSKDALPFAVTEIARIAQAAGQLGVPITNIEEFSETVLKIGTATNLSADEAATGFARFSAVTQEPLANIDRLGSAIVDLGNNFATNEAEILRFAQNIVGLAPTFGIASQDILALAAASRAAGANIEAGGTAIQQAISLMVAAASQGGAELTKFLQVTGLTAEEFRRLADEDPARLFVELLRSIRGAGGDLSATLDALGLGTIRIERELSKMAGAVEQFDQAFIRSNRAFDENTALQKEFGIFALTNAQRMQILRNRIDDTRIAIGGRLAPALIRITGIISNLDSGTVQLIAAFAGLTAAGFAFVRFRNIFGEFARTLAGGRLTATEFGAGLQIAAVQGTTFSQTLKVANAQGLTFTGLQRQLVAGNQAVITSFDQTAARTIRFGQATRAAFIETQVARAGVTGLSADLLRLQLGARLANEGLFSMTRSFVAGRITAAEFTTSIRSATAAVGGLGAALRVLGIVSLFALIGDFATQGARGIQNFFDTIARGEQNLSQAEASLLKFATGAGTIEEALEAARIQLDPSAFQQFGASVRDALTIDTVVPGTSGFEKLRETGIPVLSQIGVAFDAVDDRVTRVLNKIPLLGRVIQTDSERIQRDLGDINLAFEEMLTQLDPKVAEAVFGEISERLLTLGFTQDEITEGFTGFNNKLAAAKDNEDALAISSEDLIVRLQELGLSEAEATAQARALGLEMGNVEQAAKATAGALSALKAANEDFAQRVDSFIPTFGELVVEQRKSGAAAGGAARDTNAAARRIAEAQRALARAREDGNRRIAEAERRLAEAEEDAAERIFNARIRLQDTRISQTRRVRDAQQALQDFQAALARVGGAQAPEDLLRLRDLEQAAADVREDAKRADSDAVRDVRQAQEDGAEAVEEAQRRIVEAQREAAERVADAQRRLAEAMEKSAERASRAAQRVADTIVRTTSSLVESFRTNTRLLNTFSGEIEKLAPKVFAAFGDRDLGEAFLARLAELGPDAIPLLKNLNKKMKPELEKIGVAFENSIKAAKRRADLQFDRFPGNFSAKIKPAVTTIVTEMSKSLDAFDALGSASQEATDITAAELKELGGQIAVFARNGVLTLTPVEQSMLDIGLETTDSRIAVEKLRTVMESLKSRDIDLDLNIKVDTNLEKILKRIITTVEGEVRTIRPEFFAQHGAFVRKGQIGVVGEAGRELFVPSTNGTIISNRETERILRALQTLAPTSGGFVQHVTVNEVAQDPIATARAVSWAVARGAVR